nr:helix-turn-helix domain-containing protein [Cupriavidus taiwanensis]
MSASESTERHIGEISGVNPHRKGRNGALPQNRLQKEVAFGTNLRVAFVLRPHFSLTAVATIVDTLRFAADEGAKSRPIRCTWTFVGDRDAPTFSSAGIPIAATEAFGDVSRFDVIVVVAGLIEREPPLDAHTLAFIRAADRAGKQIAGIGTGVLPLLQAGLLDGRSCSAHWFRFRDFADRFPKVRFRTDRVLIADGRYVTCAGATAAGHFGVWLIRQHHGDALAHKCMDMLLLPENIVQPQPPAPVLAQSERVRRAMLILEETVTKPLRIEQIAERLGVSSRHLQRVFREELGMTLQTYSRTLRLHYGLWQVHSVGSTVAHAALECGFTDAAHFSRVCMQTYGKRPLAFSKEEVAKIADEFGHRASRIAEELPPRLPGSRRSQE